MNDDLKEQVQRALNRAYFFLKFRPRSKKEVVDYLHKKADRYHWSQEVIDAALLDLEEQDLINDRKFVEWFVEQRSATKPKSQFALKYELNKYGIDKDLISQFFEESPQEEEQLALDALRKHWYRFERLSKKERFEKSAAFLARRGFSFGTIKKAISTLEGSDY